jgi:hypothetical protein
MVLVFQHTWETPTLSSGHFDTDAQRRQMLVEVGRFGVEHKALGIEIPTGRWTRLAVLHNVRAILRSVVFARDLVTVKEAAQRRSLPDASRGQRRPSALRALCPGLIDQRADGRPRDGPRASSADRAPTTFGVASPRTCSIFC